MIIPFLSTSSFVLHPCYDRFSNAYIITTYLVHVFINEKYTSSKIFYLSVIVLHFDIFYATCVFCKGEFKSRNAINCRFGRDIRRQFDADLRPSNEMERVNHPISTDPNSNYNMIREITNPLNSNKNESNVNTSENVCTVCLESLANSEIKIVSLPCDNRHAFHYECIQEWFMRH